MIKILFVGNYLSKSRGTFGVSEQIALTLNSKSITVKLTSRKQNQILRLLNIIISCLFYPYKKIQIDTYSGKAFIIAEVASFLAKRRGRHIILTLHGGKLPEFYKKNPHRTIRVFNRASHLQTPSLYLQNFFQKQGIQINYLPNPINIGNFPYKRDNIKTHSLLWVRAFTNIYNPDLAVKALFEVQKHFPNATLTMVGPDKGLLNQTRHLINILGLNEYVEIVGPVRNDLLYQYYQTHEVFLNTTSYESFGVAVVEAASCGIPVVSTKVGEIPHLWIHEENMLITASFEANLFAKEIIKLFNSKELAFNISKNARNKAENFDWKKIKYNWIELLNA